MASWLLMPDKDVMKRLLVVVEGIVGRHDGTSGIAEKHIHTLMFEASHQSLSTSYFLVHYSLVILIALQRYE
jgi:hypothetical protein